MDKKMAKINSVNNIGNIQADTGDIKDICNVQIVCLYGKYFDENTYIIIDEKSKNICIIDPGLEADKIIGYIEENGFKLKYILLTHAHIDHILGLTGLAERYQDTEIIASKFEDERLTDLNHNLGIGFDDFKCATHATKTVFNNYELYQKEDITLEGFGNISMYSTPGHTRGSICIKYMNILFTGDTIFPRRHGITDLPSGSKEEMNKSLKYIFTNICEENIILPGHDEKTTVYTEKRRISFE